MQRAMSKVIKKWDAYDSARIELELKVREVCDFNARIDWCAGDGHVVLNEETSHVSSLGCLHGKTEDNKLSEEEHLKNCF